MEKTKNITIMSTIIKELFLPKTKEVQFLIPIFLLLNIAFFYSVGPYWTSVLMLAQFLYCLFRSTEAYPAITGGLLLIEAVLLGLVSPPAIWTELQGSFDVIMLVLYMVAAIYFLKKLMTYLFVNMFVSIKNKIILSFVMTFTAALLSAFLDALTVTVVVLSVVDAMYKIIIDFRAGKTYGDSVSNYKDKELRSLLGPQIKDFRKFLSSLIVHALIGTALGGVMTMVGEPQNVMLVKIINEILIKHGMEPWDFNTFFIKMLPITLPTLIAGLGVTLVLEKFKIFGFGQTMSNEEREVLLEWKNQQTQNIKENPKEKYSLIAQVIVAILLIVMLITHFAEVGVIGLFIIVLASAFTSKKEEHDFSPAFEEGGPFLVILGVLFAFVAMLHQQHTFEPVIEYAQSLNNKNQTLFFFGSSGFLSAVSDNVFVAKLFMDAAVDMLTLGGSRELTIVDIHHLEKLTIAINAGTNIFSVITPNGQAALLFLLTSALAKDKLSLSWLKIFTMTLPYAIVMIIVSLSALIFFL